jgi:hypothetical protein
MTINEKKREYIDKEIFNILDLLEESKFDVVPKKAAEVGSIAQKIPIDLSDKIVDGPIFLSETSFGNVMSKKVCYSGDCIGLNQINYAILLKLVNTIYQEKAIRNSVSKEFIETIVFEWLVNTYKNKKVESIFSHYLLDRIQESLKKYKFHFPLMYLDIGRPFQIGDVVFSFFTKDYLDQIVKYHKERHPERNYSDFQRHLESYQGKVFVSYVVEAERQRAEEIALSHCSLAVDVLKMCSETTDVPFVELGFDIDRRVKINPQSETIVSDAENDLEGFNVSFARPTHHHVIDDKEWPRIVQRQIADFHKFLLTLSPDPSELENLIINGIKRYGNAISNKNLHQRIVELFIILESLLLIDKNSQIIESVCKYSSKLVFKEVEERKFLINLLKTMYEVRSNLIHHGKETDFEIDSLRKLQYTVIMLLVEFIKRTEKYKDKQSLLQEIDDAILRAY